MGPIKPPSAEELGARDPVTTRVFDDPELAKELSAIQAEQERRDAANPGRRVRYPDLAERLEQAFAAAEQRSGRAPRPELRVKVGDFVNLLGRRYLVERVDARTRVVDVSHVFRNRSWTLPIDGVGIEPDSTPLTPDERQRSEEAVAKAARAAPPPEAKPAAVDGEAKEVRAQAVSSQSAPEKRSSGVMAISKGRIMSLDNWAEEAGRQVREDLEERQRQHEAKREAEGWRYLCYGQRAVEPSADDDEE